MKKFQANIFLADKFGLWRLDYHYPQKRRARRDKCPAGVIFYGAVSLALEAARSSPARLVAGEAGAEGRN